MQKTELDERAGDHARAEHEHLLTACGAPRVRIPNLRFATKIHEFCDDVPTLANRCFSNRRRRSRIYLRERKYIFRQYTAIRRRRRRRALVVRRELAVRCDDGHRNRRRQIGLLFESNKACFDNIVFRNTTCYVETYRSLSLSGCVRLTAQIRPIWRGS